MTSTIFGKAWGLMILALVIAESIFLGNDLRGNNWHGAIVDGILLAFWTFTLIWLHFMSIREVRHDLEFEHTMDELHKKSHDVIGDLMKDLDEKMAPRKKFVELFNEVTGVDFFEAKTISAKHKAEIEKRYHDQTGKYVTVTVKSGGVIGAEISEKKPVTKKAPVKKTVTKKKGTK